MNPIWIPGKRSVKLNFFAAILRLRLTIGALVQHSWQVIRQDALCSYPRACYLVNYPSVCLPDWCWSWREGWGWRGSWL